MKIQESGQRWAMACAAALAVAFLLAAAEAIAFSQPIETKVIYVRPGKLYKFVSSPAWELPMPVTGPGDPFALGGSVKVTLNGEQLTCTLAPRAFDHGEGWLRITYPNGPRRWKYLNRHAPDGIGGPCKYVRIRKHKLVVLAKDTGSLVVLGEGLNSEVSMELVTGSDDYCAVATPPYFLAEREGYLLRAKGAPAPVGCWFPDADGDGVEDSIDTCPNTYNPAQTGLEDNGDGTVTDSTTCLMWEKKDSDDATPNPANLHDVDNEYSWAGCCDGICSGPDAYCQPNAAAAAACGGAVGCSECSVGTCDVDPTGYGLAITTIWDWLVQANAEGFAGYSDWRIPSEDGCNACYTGYTDYSCSCDPAELESILIAPYPCGTSPCIDPIFGPTAYLNYWSGSTDSSFPSYAWFVDFYNGGVNSHYKHDVAGRVRAVRGGL